MRTQPKEQRTAARRDGRCAFTTVEMVIALIILGLLLALAAPNWVRARQVNNQKACISNLARIDAAERQWALDNKKSDGAQVNLSNLVGSTSYIQATPICPSNGTYATTTVGTVPTCTFGNGHVLTTGN